MYIQANPLYIFLYSIIQIYIILKKINMFPVQGPSQSICTLGAGEQVDARRRMLIDTQAGYYMQFLPPPYISTCTGVPDSPLAMHARICMHKLICRDGKKFVLGDNIKFIPVSTAPRIDFHLKIEAQLAKVNVVRQQVDLGSVKSCRLPANLEYQLIKARFNSQYDPAGRVYSKSAGSYIYVQLQDADRVHRSYIDPD